MKEWININGSTKTCGQCAYKAYLGENAHGCGKAGKCKKGAAEDKKCILL